MSSSSPSLGDCDAASDELNNGQKMPNKETTRESGVTMKEQLTKAANIEDEDLDFRLKPLPCDMSRGATFTERYKYINKIYKVSEQFYPKVKTSSKAAERLRQKSIEVELGICKKSGNSSIYKHFLAILIKDIIKNKGYKPKTPHLKEQKHDLEERYNILLTKIPDSKDLSSYGFEIVESADFDEVKRKINADGLRGANLKKTCERCKEEYSIEEYNKNVTCKFHGLRPYYSKGFYEYPCCGKNCHSEDKEPCEMNDFHVFRPTDFLDRSIISDYIIESALPEGKRNILALDCEMGYTTKGYEMIRLTIVDFHTEHTIYDKIIKPIGSVIDLNTKFSGVSEIPEDALTFEEARKEFVHANLINKNSILIGHGLENDLHVMRITHSKIIDTCYICFSKINKRRPLKKLTFQFLSKVIQIGEHDSAEDAICALQIVKKEYFDDTVTLDWSRL